MKAYRPPPDCTASKNHSSRPSCTPTLQTARTAEREAAKWHYLCYPRLELHDSRTQRFYFVCFLQASFRQCPVLHTGIPEDGHIIQRPQHRPSHPALPRHDPVHLARPCWQLHYACLSPLSPAVWRDCGPGVKKRLPLLLCPLTRGHAWIWCMGYPGYVTSYLLCGISGQYSLVHSYRRIHA